MSALLANRLMQVPSVQQFLNALLGDLSERRSLLVLLPAEMKAIDLWYAIERHLVRQDFHIEEILLPALPTEDSPTVALGEALNVQWPEDSSPRSIVNLMISKGLPDIVHLKGFDELPEPARTTWLIFLSEWAQVSQGLSTRKDVLPALILFTPGFTLPAKVPESNVRLSVHHWWGFPSALEVQLLCRLESASDEQSPRHRWREHLIPAVAGSDIMLAGHLYDHLDLDSPRLLSLLQEFGDQFRWTRQDLQEWGADDFLRTHTHNEGPLSSPPLRWYRLWTHGALNWTPEYGLELHTAALALLNRTEDVKHRLWRGQTSLLFPLIDNVRLAICRHLSHRYGKNWPVRWDQPRHDSDAAAVRDTPLACQWSHLALLFKPGSCAPLHREQYHLQSVVQLTSQIRNKLAHYQPITLGDFERLWREMRQLPQRIKVTMSA